MAKEVQICPHCGNYVQASKVKSYSNKVTRQGAKSAVHMATSAGGMATGAAVGSAILPGIGTVVGGALGFIGSAMFNQAVNSGIDSVADELTDFELNFTCPKCGYSWKDGEHAISNTQDDISVRIEHDIIQGNAKGMLIHLKFEVSGLKDQECSVTIWPCDSDYHFFPDVNGRFSSDEGYIMFEETFTPPYENSIYNDFVMFIPYCELHIKEAQQLDLIISIHDSNGDIVSSATQTITWNGEYDYIKNWHEFNVVRDGQKGMVIHTRFEVEHMNGQKGAILIGFRNADDYSPCKDEDGDDIYAVEHFYPNYDSCLYEDYDVFVPYELLNNVEKSFYYIVSIYHYEDERLILKGQASNDIGWR